MGRVSVPGVPEGVSNQTGVPSFHEMLKRLGVARLTLEDQVLVEDVAGCSGLHLRT
jgi:hypothetical protein